MSDLKCNECGTIIARGVTECPSCGCPVTEIKAEELGGIAEKKKVNVRSIVSLVLGIVIIIMGVLVMNKEVSVDTYTAKHYDAEYVAFGGDFYTEIYGASDIIVDELSDINGGIGLLSESMAVVANSIYYPIGMMIIALGLGVVAISCNHMKKE